MTDTTHLLGLNDALDGLLKKYAIQPSGPWKIGDGNRPASDGDDVRPWLVSGCLLDAADLSEATVPLLPWRHERRFVELKRLLDEETVSPLLMCRFACLTDGVEMSLKAILYREFDLVEWLSGSPIVGLYASMANSRAANVAEKGVRSNLPERPEGCFAQIGPDPFFAANVIVRLGGGAIGSVEAGTTLPAGADMQDRHELIARRGVASDRVVDTQVAQNSVYAWTAEGDEQHTDIDAELFGLNARQVSLVRSAYAALSDASQIAQLRQQHCHLRRLVELAFESNQRGERLAAEGGAV